MVESTEKLNKFPKGFKEATSNYHSTNQKFLLRYLRAVGILKNSQKDKPNWLDVNEKLVGE